MSGHYSQYLYIFKLIYKNAVKQLMIFKSLSHVTISKPDMISDIVTLGISLIPHHVNFSDSLKVCCIRLHSTLLHEFLGFLIY